MQVHGFYFKAVFAAFEAHNTMCAGKVVDRRWYARNKHIFPASRWEKFDPEKHFGAHMADQ